MTKVGTEALNTLQSPFLGPSLQSQIQTLKLYATSGLCSRLDVPTYFDWLYLLVSVASFGRMIEERLEENIL